MIKIAIFLLILSALHAKLELMIEGKKSGWACKLPCWSIETKISNWLLGNKPLTGYHFWMLIMYLFLFHSPYLFIPLNLKTELIILGFFCWYWVSEDFCWFLENSLYGLRNFKKGRIAWHRRWIWFLPVSYIWGIIIGTILLLLGGLKC
jgi:hypothetical protein